MFPFFPYRRHRFHRHRGCLGGLLRLVLVALGVKYVVDRTQNQQSAQIWPPSGQQPQNTPQQPRSTPGRDTARLNKDD